MKRVRLLYPLQINFHCLKKIQRLWKIYNIHIEDANTKNNLISYLKKYGGSNVKVATFTLLRMMFSDTTGSKYSWVGAKKKKDFSSLRIFDFEAMSDAIRGCFKDATVHKILVYL